MVKMEWNERLPSNFNEGSRHAYPDRQTTVNYTQQPSRNERRKLPDYDQRLGRDLVQRSLVSWDSIAEICALV